MQPVGVVVAGDPQSRRRQSPLEHRAAIDADVSAGHVVVRVRERPIDQFGPEPGHRDGHGAAGSQHPGELGHRADVVGDVLEHLGADDAVEDPVGEGQMQSVALDGGGAQTRGGQLARLRHRGERRRDPFDLVASGVEGHDVRTPSSRLEGVTPEPTTEVQDRVAARDAQLVVVGGEHQSNDIDVGQRLAREDRS